MIEKRRDTKYKRMLANLDNPAKSLRFIRHLTKAGIDIEQLDLDLTSFVSDKEKGRVK